MQTNSPLLTYLKQLRRAIHQQPELSFKEYATGELIRKELDRLEISHSQIARTGVRAVIEGTACKPGCGKQQQPVVALRADMDALPIKEKTGLSFASQASGVMHACGHDGHVAMLLGAARILREAEFYGTVVLLFQPAEETASGADLVVTEGGLQGVDMIFGGHIDTHFATGTFTVDEGLICSYADPFIIRIHGRGGHAARPHEAIDSVVLASTLVMNMQTLVSRQINPTHAAVVTVGRMEAGTVLNAIAEDAIMEGTIRSAHPETRNKLRAALRRLILGVKDMSNAAIDLEFLDGLPAVINDPRSTGIARAAAARIVGEKYVTSQGAPSLGGEDFAFYQQQIPGCMIRFGAQTSGDQVGPAHSGRYDFDEAVLELGARWLATVALEGLSHLGEHADQKSRHGTD